MTWDDDEARLEYHRRYERMTRRRWHATLAGWTIARVIARESVMRERAEADPDGPVAFFWRERFGS